ncbi:MAG: hypothetical protein ACK2UU_21040 [Anaerolineae bacterium]|jgi:hypothetical protein
MTDRIPYADTVIFTGRFGSGKSETAINYAISLGRRLPRGEGAPGSDKGRPVGAVLIDLDIVTPYFRSRETADRLLKLGVRVVAPSVIGQHLDTPAITPQILGAIQQSDLPVVLDVGGDKQGARALGQFSTAISQGGYTMHFVVNPYRPFTDTLAGVRSSIAEIEASSRLQVSSLVSNPNLIGETTVEQILQGHAQIERYGQALGLPIAFVCVERQWVDALLAGDSGGSTGGPFAQPVLVLDRYFVLSWEPGSPDEQSTTTGDTVRSLDTQGGKERP